MSALSATFTLVRRPVRHRGFFMVEVSAALAVVALVSVDALALGIRVFRAYDIRSQAVMVGDIVNQVHHLFAGAPDYTGISNYEVRAVPGFAKHIRNLPGIRLAISSIGGRQVAVTSNPGGHMFFVAVPIVAPDECMALARVEDPSWLMGTTLDGVSTPSGTVSIAGATTGCANASAGSPVTVRFTYR